MATPANPFAALHQNQTDGAASSIGRGRGRGGQFRGATSVQPRGASGFQPRGGNSNVSNVRGRGRGRGAHSARADRGARGAGATSNTWRVNKTEQQSTSTPSTASPFSQLKQNQPIPSPATGPTAEQKPPFSGFGRASPTLFGAQSHRGGTTFTARVSQQSPANPTNGVTATSVPVEDASAMGNYNDRYEQLKIDRAKQREQAIKAGQMADPNQPMSLNKAITPVGTCTSMCPEFERVERIVQKMVDKSEKYLHPATNTLQNMEAKMLKRFRRSAAGYDEQLPSDIRTPRTLLQTMNYLTRHVIGGPEPLGIIHKFVWDRTRSIRNDFSVQQLTQEEDVKIAVTCLERIARFHIVSLHLLSSPANEEPFDRHQEREQLNNTMLSLMYYYDDNRGRISFPNEDEFRAYYIIFSIHDQRPDLEARVQKWPPELRNAPRVRVALELFAAAGNTWEYQGTLDAKRPNAIAQGFYARFFSLVNSPGVSYLMACVAEIYFNHMRQTAIRSIWKGYCRYPSSQQHKNEEWTIDELTNVLCFDDNDQTIQFCAEQDLQFAENANGELYLNWGSRPVDSVAFQPSSDHSFSENYVEWKRSGRTLVAVVLGLNVREAAALGMIDKSSLSERASALAPEKQMSIDNDDSLFVSEDENDAHPQPSATTETLAGAGPVTVFAGISQATESQPSTNSNPNPFSSLFPANSTKTGTSAPSSPPLNPFAKAFIPFSSSQPSQTSQPAVPSPAAASTGQSSSLFASADTTSILSPSQNEKPPIAPATTPFNFPTTSQPATSQTPPPTLFQNLQKTPASPTPPFGAFQSTSNIKPDQPSAPPTQSSNTPLLAASSTPFSVEPDKPIDATAGQSSTSIFNIGRPTPEAKSPPFSFSKPSELSPAVLEPQAVPEILKSQLAASTTVPTLQSDPEKDEKETSLFSTFPEQPRNSIFKARTAPPFAPKSAASPSERPTVTSAIGKPSEAIPASQTVSSPASNVVIAQSSTPQPPIPTISEEAEPTVPAEPAIGARPDIREGTSTVEAIKEEQAFDEAEQEAQRKTEWINSLREAADRRRNIVSTPPSRKRVLEQETPPTEMTKPIKVAKPQQPLRKSMALSSMKPLPKLPILEQIESMNAREPTEPRPESSKPRHIDKDDLLLSAARIAAESLRTGPRLLSVSAPYEPWRSSFSPGSSVSSVAFSRSESPQQSPPGTSGYEVSYAPDTNLGLGRSLSRTEQRIRMTGGKGLAYKPLNLTPKNKISWRATPKK
ncbi:hypothetical protein BDW75DRAFT_214053 [Aspergillus navahoensis]